MGIDIRSEYCYYYVQVRVCLREESIHFSRGNRYTVIPRLAEILAETQKEKVTRMIVAFLRVSNSD